MMALFDLWTWTRANWKIAVMVIAVVVAFLVGWNVRGWKADASDKSDLIAAIKLRESEIERLQLEVGQQSEMARVIAAEKAILVEQNNKLNAEIEASYDKIPANTNSCIAPVRVQLLNKQRDAANRISRAGRPKD